MTELNTKTKRDHRLKVLSTQPKLRSRMIIIIVFISHILGIISAIDAVMSTKTSQGAIAWAASLVMVPYFAVPTYWVFGRAKFAGVAEARRENESEIDKLLESVTPKIQSTFVETKQHIPEYEALLNLSQFGMTADNKAELLINGEATFSSILEGISKAEKYILLEFYIVRDDVIGRRLKEALIERANNGVKVYFVYDEIGSSDLPASFGNDLLAAGIEFSPFNTTRGWRNRFQLNFRNHRKIVVVDGHSAWLGGLNVGDEYLGSNPKLSPWRDTHLRIDGAAALQVQATFLADWYWSTRQLPSLQWDAYQHPSASSEVMIIASSPAQKLETAGLFFTHLINSSKKKLWMTTPYFIPDEGLMAALQLAALRGVDVRIIIPNKSDGFIVKMASMYYVEELADSGIKFYQYNSGFTHQKVMLIDDDFSTIGTANFDIRSFRLNFEITALIRDRKFSDEVKLMLENDMQQSLLMNLDELEQLPYWQHAIHRIARLFSPVL